MFPYYTFQPSVSDRRWMHCMEIAPNCPRCDSLNTKFCYYNNYSLSQPRYFCKSCRRYWTKGGSLRNIPVRSGCRRSRRSKPASISSPSSPPSTNSHQHDYSSFRPDHALEGMASSPAVDGSSIDLALLYAKFLNKCPEESLDRSAPGSSSSSAEQVAPAPELMSSFGAGVECHRNAEVSEVTTLLNVEQSGCESMEFLMEGICHHDYISSSFHPLASDTMWNNPRAQVSGSELGDAIYPQENLLVGDWSTFDQPSSETFYKF